MLFNQEFLLETGLTSGEVKAPFFSELDRLRIVGRFVGVFVTEGVGTEGGVGIFSNEDVAPLVLDVSWAWFEGRPPCAEVRGGTSLDNPGEDGACWR